MQDIASDLEIGSPVIWIVTSEPERAADLVAARVQNKPFFKMDPDQGLVTRVGSQWMRTLVDLPNGDQGGTYNLITALSHVSEVRGVLVVKNAHQVAEKLIEHLLDLFATYRKSFYEDNYDTLPAQIVCVSPTAEMPPELTQFVMPHYLSAPDQEELGSLVDHVAERIPKMVTAEKLKLTRAGAGLAEQDFIKAMLLGAVEDQQVTAERINAFRMEKLRRNSGLEIVPSTVSLADVGGLDLLKETIIKIIWCLDNPAEAAAQRTVAPTSMLFLGVPGSGKSLTCKAIAGSMGIDLVKVGISRALNKFIGNSEANMRHMFAMLAAMSPVVAWCDEIGRDASDSTLINDGGTTSRVMGEFLTGLQELPDDVLFVATANSIASVPPEMLRKGRFDSIIFCGFPVQVERIQILGIHLADEDDIDIEAVSAATSYFTGVELQALVEKVRFDNMEKNSITTQDLLEGARTMRNRVWLTDKEGYKSMYRRAMNQYDWASSAQKAMAELVIDERPLNELGTGEVGVGAGQDGVVKRFR